MGFWSWLVTVLGVPVGAVGVLWAGAGLLRWARRPRRPLRGWAEGPPGSEVLVRLGDGLEVWLEAVVDSCSGSSDGDGGGADDGGGCAGGGDGGGD